MSNAYDSLSLYLFPSFAGVDWACPRALVSSVLKSFASFQNRQLGHVAVGIQAAGEETPRALTGMTDLATPNLRHLIWEGAALGMLTSFKEQ